MSLTPEQFNLLVTKEDLKNELKNYATKDDVSTILTAIDGLTKKVDAITQEFVSNTAAHDRMNDNICDHETRIKNLELKAA